LSMRLQDHIKRYMELAARTERTYASVREKHPDLMPCSPGCDDCCNVYFELSLIEAFAISAAFRECLGEGAVQRALDRARLSLPMFRHTHRLIHEAQESGGDGGGQALKEASTARILCALNENGQCVMYDHRPITCRLYGTPQKIGQRVVSCPKTGFAEGKEYSTVDVDRIQLTLFEYSRDFLVDLIGATPVNPPGPLFSLPEALETTFDKKFFVSLRDSLASE
jgi:hypothetical protein